MQLTESLGPDDRFKNCPYCNSTNIYEDDGWWYCNYCGEVWEEEDN